MKLGNMKTHFNGEDFTLDVYRNFLEKQAKALIAF
jgi:hypothetical protein